MQIKADPLGVAGDCCVFYLLTSKALTYSQSLTGWHWEGVYNPEPPQSLVPFCTFSLLKLTVLGN